MFTNDQFKSLLIRTIDRNYLPSNDEVKSELIQILKKSDISLEETDEYTYYQGYNKGWNTLCTYLKIRTDFENLNLLESNTSFITNQASTLYDKQGDNVLVDTILIPKADNYEVMNFKQIKINEIIILAIEDSEKFMNNGQYSQAFDRVHTAFHGYLIEILKKYGVSVDNNENLSKLYNKIHTLIDNEIQPSEIARLVKTTIRSSNGIISSLNEARNKYSLAHPNSSIIGEREAKLIIGITSVVTEYISEYLDV